jgi:hypothetical protein
MLINRLPDLLYARFSKVPLGPMHKANSEIIRTFEGTLRSIGITTVAVSSTDSPLIDIYFAELLSRLWTRS